MIVTTRGMFGIVAVSREHDFFIIRSKVRKDAFLPEGIHIEDLALVSSHA